MEGMPVSGFVAECNEKTKQVEELVAAFDRSRKLPSKDALVQQLSKSWPCTHRMDPYNLSKLQTKCENPEIEARLKSNPDYLWATRTSSFHWNLGEAVTGEKAIVAGLIEHSAKSLREASDLFLLYQILGGIFSDLRLPVHAYAQVGEAGKDTSYEAEYVADLSVGEALLREVYRNSLTLEWLHENEFDIEQSEVDDALKLYESLSDLITDYETSSSKGNRTEAFAGFSEASKRAKELSLNEKKVTRLRRTQAGWEVIVETDR
ncbi:hypothetical protein MYE70_00675 [Marinobacter alexandrii]|uniref:hypothetical protein n=1 Tax=Marinobacter alexandrii TaxID=2570351 RepID=UPI001FFEF103|nr:hypothetical protein [Marinobacter alexandrii]MCK2147571.1 hypothetical protein [Marinobacter alexandrii]